MEKTNLETGLKFYDPDDLRDIPVVAPGGEKSLRSMVRTIYGPSTWVASAPKALCFDLLTTGRRYDGPVGSGLVAKPEPKPEGTSPKPEAHDAAGDLAAAIRAIAGASMDESRVRAIVAESVTPDSIKETVNAAVEAAFASVKAIKLQIPGKPEVDCRGEHEIFPRLIAHATRGTRTWVAGPAGSGKTTGVWNAAEAIGMKVFLQPPSLTRFDVLGYLDAQSNYVDSAVSLWARETGPACLILDEVDSWGEAAQIAANLPLANGHLPLTGGDMVAIYASGAPKWIVATANTWGTGPNADYIGRKKMDAAFLNRFSAKIYWGYDEALERRLALAHAGDKTADAERLLSKIFKARGHCESKGIKILISPRQTFDAVKALACGDSQDQIWSEILLGGSTQAQSEEIRAAVGAR